jgi:hypothetical protein
VRHNPLMESQGDSILHQRFSKADCPFRMLRSQSDLRLGCRL